MQSTIKIGPSFFAKAKNDYSNWTWAWIRELAQNSMDCKGTTEIEFKFSVNSDGNTVAICQNNGEPMDYDTLVNKFLSLGESGKNFNGTIGGFGKAKELIAFCHKSYKIHTGNLLVTGEGADYQLVEVKEKLAGTKTEVVMLGNYVSSLENALIRFCRHAQWEGTVTYSGKHLETNQHKGTFRRELSFGRVYTNQNVKGAVCRIHGIPMFIDTYCTDRGVIIELNGNSGTTLTSNRDMLSYTYRNELSQFTKMLNTDATKALSAPNPTVTYYPGHKCYIRQTTTKQEKSEAIAAKVTQSTVYTFNSETTQSTAVEENDDDTNWAEICDIPAEQESQDPQEVNQLGFNFYIRNETRLVVPNHFLPTQMSEYATKLSHIWANVLLTMHQILESNKVNVPSTFSVGFVFSENTEALYHQKDGEVTYYLNPCSIAQDRTGTRFKKRFLLTEKERIISIAVHEIVHALGYEYHDEDYACKLTELFAVAMKNRTKFNACFRV